MTTQSTTPRTDAIHPRSLRDAEEQYRELARKLETDLARTRAALEGCVKALKAYQSAMEQCGEWDDNAFYYHKTSASELQEPMRKADAALAAAEKEGAKP